MRKHFQVCLYGHLSGDYQIEVWDAP